MDVEKVKGIFRRKPMLFLVISLWYLLLVGFAKWGIHPTWGTATFLLGGYLGVYFLDIAEVFFALNPSPFRSIVFSVAFAFVALFIVTSSDSTLAPGLVLSLYMSLILWQVGEWKIANNLNSWYRMIAIPVRVQVQWWILMTFIGFFIMESFLFIR